MGAHLSIAKTCDVKSIYELSFLYNCECLVIDYSEYCRVGVLASPVGKPGICF